MLGTRPNILKAVPVVRALKAKGIAQRIIWTGQHYDSRLFGQLWREAALPHPDVSLCWPHEAGAHAIDIVAKQLSDIFEAMKPQIVVVYGDVHSSVAGARAAKQNALKLAHVESGLRSADPEPPEEKNRREIDLLSDLLFCPTDYAAENLLMEKVDARKIIVSGNTQLEYFLENQKKRTEKPVATENRILVTLHRERNSGKERFRHWLEALQRLTPHFEVLFPLHPKHSVEIDAFPGINFQPPMTHEMLSDSLAVAALVLTDSGGLQIEAEALNKPCIIANNATPWKHLETAPNIRLLDDPELLTLSWVNSFLNSIETTTFGRMLIPVPSPSHCIASRLSDELCV